jgi:hypothetical protein
LKSFPDLEKVGGLASLDLSGAGDSASDEEKRTGR